MTKLWVLLAACFVKKDDPELLIPPADYDAEVLESSGFTLCIDAHPTTAQVMVSSRQISDCVQVKGEVFVEVSQEGYSNRISSSRHQPWHHRQAHRGFQRVQLL